MDATEAFEAERPRLLGLATRVLGGDRTEDEHIVQRAWLRLNAFDTHIESLPAWLTTVTTRLCLDRLRVRTTQVVLDRLPPRERFTFVLHDSFGFELTTIAAALDTTPIDARKLASRARAKIGQPVAEDHLADWEVVDGFMAAARKATSTRLIRLLPPQAVVLGDDAAKLGTPERIDGQRGGRVLQRRRPLAARGA